MPGGRRARRNSRRLPLAAYSTSTYKGPGSTGTVRDAVRLGSPIHQCAHLPPDLPPCVQAPSRLMMFLCLPIIFIISISDTRSDRSLSVASSVPGTGVSAYGPKALKCPLYFPPSSPFSIFTATVTGLAVRSLSMPIASAMTTCPKQPSPRGLPSVSLAMETEAMSVCPVPQTLMSHVPLYLRSLRAFAHEDKERPLKPHPGVPQEYLHLVPSHRTPTRYILNPTKYILSLTTTDRVLDSSHLGSAGSSSSETLARAGPSVDCRVIRRRGALEFIEELDSKDTCLGHQVRLVPHNVGWALEKGWGW